METKVIDTEIFTHHAMADLNSGFMFIVLFSQEKPLRWNEINTYIETPFNNNSKIPETQCYITNKLSSVKFEGKDIVNIIRSLDVNKAHDHRKFPIRMLTLYESTIVEPLYGIILTAV